MFPRRFSASSMLIIAVSLLAALPILMLCTAWFAADKGGFAYYIRHGLLAEYAANSLAIALLTGICALGIGTATAWATTMWRFPGSRALGWLLVLPLAVPGYVAAMIYGALLEGAGPVQQMVRDVSGLAFGEYWFPPIRSFGGVVFILTLTLYPYVYLFARAAFAAQSRQMLETGEILGCSRRRLFLQLALPAARPALVAGAALVMMEALADFGVVSLYGVPAFTTGIYRAWQGLYDPVAAVRMASVLLAFVLVALWLERRARRQARYHNATGLYHPLPRRVIPGVAGWSVMLACALPVLLGCGVPVAAMVRWSLSSPEVFLDPMTGRAMFHSLQLATATALVTTAVGLAFAYALRKRRSGPVAAAVRLATLGYAIPGSVIAVGVLWLLVRVQQDIFAGKALLTGAMLGVVWGCALRFLTVSFNSAESGLARITPVMDAVAQTLGAGRWQLMRRIHLPILKGSLLSGFLLVFIDTLKELPATLLLRPFNLNTLAIRTYELAQDELLSHAAPTALLLVLAGLVPVCLLWRRLAYSRPCGQETEA